MKKSRIIKLHSSVKFKPIRFKDLKLLKYWRNSLDIFPYNTQYVLLNMKNQKEWFKKIKNSNSNRKMFTININEKPIGVCGLIHTNLENKTGDIALIIGNTKFHGKGIGKVSLVKLLRYGFENLNLNRIVAEVFEYNKNSKKLFEKTGFKLEGIYRESLFRFGKWWDIHTYSILKSEYAELGLNKFYIL